MILTLTGHGLNLLMISHVLYLIISARKHIETLLMCGILPTNWPPKCYTSAAAPKYSLQIITTRTSFRLFGILNLWCVKFDYT